MPKRKPKKPKHEPVFTVEISDNPEPPGPFYASLARLLIEIDRAEQEKLRRENEAKSR